MSPPLFNQISDRYIYTEKGGWIDMVHFLYYASEAYSYKKEYMQNPSNAYLGLTESEIIDKSINHSVRYGYMQERLDTIKAKHSAFSYEDLPSDYYGSVFGAKYFNPDSSANFGQQLLNYMKNQLGATSPYHAPNYSDLPNLDNGTHSGIENKTIKPLFIK